MMWRSGIVVENILGEERLSEPSQKCRPILHNRVRINPHDYLKRSKVSRRNRALLDVLRPEIKCHVAISTYDHVELAGSTRLRSIEGEQKCDGWDAAREYIVRELGRTREAQLRIISPEIAAQEAPILAVSSLPI